MALVATERMRRQFELSREASSQSVPVTSLSAHARTSFA
jgi:hypothetical protein